MILLSLALAKPDVAASAALLLQQQGFQAESVEPMPEKKGWFIWSGTRDGQVCKGSVEVTKAHAKKPKGRFSSACNKPTLPDGTWEAAEECGVTSAGTPVAVYWTLSTQEGGFSLTADGFQTSYAYTGTLAGMELVITHEHGEPVSESSVAFIMVQGAKSWIAQPVSVTLNCSESLEFSASGAP